MTGSEFISRLKKEWPQAQQSFRFPTNYIRIISDKLGGDEDEQEEIIAQSLGITRDALLDICDRLSFRLLMASAEDEVELPSDSGVYWLREMMDGRTPQKLTESTACKVIHFYGYKGGQGRSTVLAFLARVLADEGWRVLTMDVDAEAPSLDVLFEISDVNITNTMIALRAEQPVEPVKLYRSPNHSGFIDLIPFRPRGEQYDLDAAALASEAAVFPTIAEQLAQNLRPTLENYDVLLVDHRTGLSATVLPWVSSLPGPVVNFARMDGQWRHALSVFRILWRAGGGEGALISMVPSGQHEDLQKFRIEHQGQALPLLDQLAAARPGDLQGADLSVHWVLWPHDDAFLREGLPHPQDVNAQTRKTVHQIRNLLELNTSQKNESPNTELPSNFLCVPAWEHFQVDTPPIVVVWGAPGSGKTKLARALLEKGAHALVIPEDAELSVGVLPAQAPSSSPHWWSLLAAAIKNHERVALNKALQTVDTTAETTVREWAKTARKPMQLVIDGIQNTRSNMYTLSSFLGIIEADTVLKHRLRFIVFLNHIADPSQPRPPSVIIHRWDSHHILQFLLFRILEEPWFQENFSDFTQKLMNRKNDLLRLSVNENECDELIQEIFPEVILHSVPISTFLRTWFVDEPSVIAGYSPFVVHVFVKALAEDTSFHYSDYDGSMAISEEQVLSAHKFASKQYLERMCQEILLGDNKVESILNELREQPNTFNADPDFITKLASHASVSYDDVHRTFEAMKRLGMLYIANDNGRLQAGRLTTTALDMTTTRRDARTESSGLGGLFAAIAGATIGAVAGGVAVALAASNNNKSKD